MERAGVVVIGGGAVGCAVALELAPGRRDDVFLLERMPSVGEVQSGRNSGVIHAGIYYPTGSLKAEACVEANSLVFEFCRKHRVPAARVGKLVVATTPDEVRSLETVFEQAKSNGVPAVRLLSRAEVKAFEPNIDVPLAMLVPTTGIMDAAAYTRALATLAEQAGGHVLTSFEVIHVEASAGAFEVTGRRGGREETIATEVLVNAAGLDCDLIARMVDPTLALEVVPLRGEYFKLNRRARHPLWLNGMNVYPVPEPIDLGGERPNMVGVHLTPTFTMGRDGSVDVGDVVTVGPEFVVTPSRTDYESGRKPASFFLERAKRYFPGLELADLSPDFAGIMVHIRGQKDFIARRDTRYPNCVQLLGIDSPGLTCSLALARRVADLLR